METLNGNTLLTLLEIKMGSFMFFHFLIWFYFFLRTSSSSNPSTVWTGACKLAGASIRPLQQRRILFKGEFFISLTASKAVKRLTTPSPPSNNSSSSSENNNNQKKRTATNTTNIITIRSRRRLGKAILVICWNFCLRCSPRESACGFPKLGTLNRKTWAVSATNPNTNLMHPKSECATSS